MAQRLKGARIVNDDGFGVCLWRMADGEFLGDEDNNLLSVQGKINDPILEANMRRSARMYVGEEALLGQPVWIPGARQVTEEEYEEQGERLKEGKIPDVIDELRQAGAI